VLEVHHGLVGASLHAHQEVGQQHLPLRCELDVARLQKLGGRLRERVCAASFRAEERLPVAEEQQRPLGIALGTVAPGRGATDIEAFFRCLAGDCCPTCAMADFDGDGDPDVLMTNGATLDDATFEPWHGVRWLENRGTAPFEMHELAALPGAHRARAADLDTVFLASPTSPEERLSRVAAASRGFVYAVSRTGVTGERQSLSADAKPLVARLRARTSVPVALGFGLSTPEQVREAAAVADGVVVGSALVRFLEEHPDGDIGARVRWLTSTT